MKIHIPEEICRDARAASRLEWLETNGLGGYASSTILMYHTRRYHGLLVSCLSKPAGRFVLLSKFEDSVVSGAKELFLSAHRYPGVFFPEGGPPLVGFEIDYCPHFVFRTGDTTIHRRLMLVYEEDRVLIRYSREGGNGSFTLRLKPFVAFRNHHELSRENHSFRAENRPVKKGFRVHPYDGMPPLCIQTSTVSTHDPSSHWYRNFEYVVEAVRGFDFHEDLFQSGTIECPLREGEDVIVSASIEEYRGSLKVKWDAEERRRKKEAMKNDSAVEDITDPAERDAGRCLIESGRHFAIRDSGKRPGIIAGYHWFYEWGRDTLISLPGLTFCSGRPGVGIAILKAMAGFEKNGLLPNVFSMANDTRSYNNVDSSLWYFWAVQQMIKYTGDWKTVRKDLWPVLKRIIRHYMEGTDFKIYMDESGLLHAGDETMQLTWMDVSIEGRPVTPRSGFAVDINALWFNALSFAAHLATVFEDGELDLKGHADQTSDSFNRVFWVEGENYLGDVFTKGVLDKAVRPNQILAVSLPFSPLRKDRWKGVVGRVQKELLIPCGLRTLSPADPAYRGCYKGDHAERDRAYHQGTAWPWLLGHFGEAFLRVADDRETARKFILEKIIVPVKKHLREAGLGLVSEICDGDSPHRPDGCIAQAWSTAEIIRLIRLMNETH